MSPMWKLIVFVYVRVSLVSTYVSLPFPSLSFSSPRFLFRSTRLTYVSFFTSSLPPFRKCLADSPRQTSFHAVRRGGGIIIIIISTHAILPPLYLFLPSLRIFLTLVY